jgi:tRNA dimethylallyltransferase
VLTGPTASGKSAIAMSLAQEYGWDIVSCDSRQIYRGMDIGTAKPNHAEQSAVRHWLIDLIEPSETYSLYRYFEDAEKVIDQLHSNGRHSIICGGTGLYLRTLIDGVGVQEESDPEIRDTLTQRASLHGTGELYEELRSVDPIRASKIHSNDAQRIIRALAVYHQTGKTHSSLQTIKEKKSRFSYKVIKLAIDRELLYQQINSRVDAMVQMGLYDEFRELVKKGYTADSPGLLCVGYREFFMHERGEITFEDAVELVKRNTRRFAKRQVTWFAHQQDGAVVDVAGGIEKTLSVVRKILKESAFG